MNSANQMCPKVSEGTGEGGREGWNPREDFLEEIVFEQGLAAPRAQTE